MRRFIGIWMLAAVLVAGCADKLAPETSPAQVAASMPAFTPGATLLPSAEAEVPIVDTPSPVVAPSKPVVTTAAPATPVTPTVTARPRPAATPRPTPVVVQTEVPVVTPVPPPPATPLPPKGFPAGSVSASEAIGYVGQVVTVCGRVASATYASYSNGGPTFLNIDKPYPNSPFAILIWEEHRASFGGAPEQAFLGARVCIRGLVSIYSGRAEIESSGGDIDVYD